MIGSSILGGSRSAAMRLLGHRRTMVSTMCVRWLGGAVVCMTGCLSGPPPLPSPLGPQGTGSSTGGATNTAGDDGSAGAEDDPMGICPFAEVDISADPCSLAGQCSGDFPLCFPEMTFASIGVCSACLHDADCAQNSGFGCDYGNPFTGRPAMCAPNGGLCRGCETSDVCQDGLVCALVLELEFDDSLSDLGRLTVSACSECRDDRDCADPRLCAPVYDINDMRGVQRCVDPGSIPLDAGCSNDAQCMSGHCAPAEFEFNGLILSTKSFVSLCSRCRGDDDCPGREGASCQLPRFGYEENGPLSFTPGDCV